PFLLMLHGATGVGLFGLWPMILFANSRDLIILAPDSRGRTWDRVHGSFGPDVAFIDQALEHVFSRYAVDPGRLGIGGFSDGASYALSLGLTNGELFKKVIAFSPGFLAPGERVGRPPVFISHGTEDLILPVSCSQRLVPRLRSEGYDVTYAEFAGGHAVPAGIAGQAATWLTDLPIPNPQPPAPNL
ncbi:MAG TPA: phospholipase, partial [Chloroflexota bacterium]|nr:phospholipase [Chloroflexota bacterium]